MRAFRRSALVSVLAVAGACAHPHPAVPAAPVRDCRRVVPDERIVITWHRPVDPGDDAPLDAWCAAVGPVVVIREPAVAIPDTIAKAPLTVVSWNTHVGGGDVPGFVAALRAGTLTGDRPVGHFVILMQEAFRASADVPLTLPIHAAGPKRIQVEPRSGERDDIVTQARALGLALYYAPAMRNGDEPYEGLGEDRGNAILSTLPLADLAAVELPFERRRRVVIMATITPPPDTKAIPLRVGSVHLDASAGPGRLYVFASGSRAKQARSFLTTLDPQQPTVIGSDLNTWSEGPRERAYTVLRDWFAQTPPPGLKHTFVFPWFRLDYLFYRLPDGWRTTPTWRAPSPFGSDHFPLTAQLEPAPR